MQKALFSPESDLASRTLVWVDPVALPILSLGAQRAGTPVVIAEMTGP